MHGSKPAPPWLSLLLLAALVAPAAHAQRPPDTAALLAAQREALAKFAFMDGVWRGTAWALLPSGEKRVLTQTERVGPFLGGSVRVIEGRGYEADGSLGFNALGIMSYKPDEKAYSFRAYAQGNVGDFVLTLTENGFSWEIPAGPMTIRYAATIKDGKWREVGDRIFPGKDPVRFYEMELTRVGDTDWPAGGATPAK